MRSNCGTRKLVTTVAGAGDRPHEVRERPRASIRYANVIFRRPCRSRVQYQPSRLQRVVGRTRAHEFPPAPFLTPGDAPYLPTLLRGQGFVGKGYCRSPRCGPRLVRDHSCNGRGCQQSTSRVDCRNQRRACRFTLEDGCAPGTTPDGDHPYHRLPREYL